MKNKRNWAYSGVTSVNPNCRSYASVCRLKALAWPAWKAKLCR